MQYIHYKIKADKDQVVQITTDHEASIKLMDTFNYAKFQKGKTCDFFGGAYPASTVEFRVHKLDEWHVVIDLEGRAGFVKASVNLIKC
jgi:hypothetical protein